MRKAIAILVFLPTLAFSFNTPGYEIGNANLGLGIAVFTIGTIDSVSGNGNKSSQERITEKTIAVGLGGFVVESAILCAIPSDKNSNNSVGIRIAISSVATIIYLGILHLQK